MPGGSGGRAYDSLYDNTYTVSGARDHFRDQLRSGAVQIEPVKDFGNYFSVLPHHPDATARLKNSESVPGFVDRDHHVSHEPASSRHFRSTASVVSGPERPKYQYQPVAGFGVPMPGTYHVRARDPEPVPEPELPPGTKVTTGTQSDYRESEAQTVPFTPDYIIPEPNEKQRALNQQHHLIDGIPEVLSLKDLSYGRGLPAGMAEAKQIEAMREKRAFDAYLASLDGPDALVLRRKAMEERELREWASREAEIRDLQEERLELLQTAIERREQEADEALQTRLANLREQRTAEKATALAAIQKKRVAAMRKLGAARTAHSVPSEPHTFLDTALEKSIKAGQVHAPTPTSKRGATGIHTTRHKYDPVDVRPFDVRTDPLKAVQLEGTLPRGSLDTTVTRDKGQKMSMSQAREANLKASQLDHINNLLEESKGKMGGRRGYGDCWPAPMGDVLIESHSDRRKKAAEAAEARARIAAEKLAAANEARALLQAQDGGAGGEGGDDSGANWASLEEEDFPDLDPSELARLAALGEGLEYMPVVPVAAPPPREPEPVEEEEDPEEEYVEFDEPDIPMPVEEEEVDLPAWEEDGPAQEVEDGDGGGGEESEFVSKRIIVNMRVPGEEQGEDLLGDLDEPPLPEGPLSEAEVRQVVTELKLMGFAPDEALEVAANMQLTHRGSSARRRVQSLRQARLTWAQVPQLPREGEDLDLHEELHAAAMHAAIIGVEQPFVPASVEERNAVLLRQLLLEDLQALQQGLEAGGLPPAAAAKMAERVQGVEGGAAAIRRCEEFISLQEEATEAERARLPPSPQRPDSRGKPDAILAEHLGRVEHLDPRVVEAELAAAVQVFDETKALAEEAHNAAAEARRASSPSRSRPGSRETSRSGGARSGRSTSPSRSATGVVSPQAGAKRGAASPGSAATDAAAAALATPAADDGGAAGGDVDPDAAGVTAKVMQEALVDAAEAERKAHEAAIGLQKLDHDLAMSKSRKKLSEEAPEPQPAAQEPEPAPAAPEPEPVAPTPEPEAPEPEPAPAPEPPAPEPEPPAPEPPAPEPEPPAPVPEAPVAERAPTPPPPEAEEVPPKSPARPQSTPSGQESHPPSPNRPVTAPVRPLSGSSNASSDREEVRVTLQIATRKQFRDMQLKGFQVGPRSRPNSSVSRPGGDGPSTVPEGTPGDEATEPPEAAVLADDGVASPPEEAPAE